MSQQPVLVTRQDGRPFMVEPAAVTAIRRLPDNTSLLFYGDEVITVLEPMRRLNELFGWHAEAQSKGYTPTERKPKA